MRLYCLSKPGNLFLATQTSSVLCDITGDGLQLYSIDEAGERHFDRAINPKTPETPNSPPIRIAPTPAGGLRAHAPEEIRRVWPCEPPGRAQERRQPTESAKGGRSDTSSGPSWDRRR